MPGLDAPGRPACANAVGLHGSGRDHQRPRRDRRRQLLNGTRFAARRLEAVLPVAVDATAVACGVVRHGIGAVRITDARFEVVREESLIHEQWPKGPDDLGFERGATQA
jgi:hypothetical protein